MTQLTGDSLERWLERIKTWQTGPDKILGLLEQTDSWTELSTFLTSLRAQLNACHGVSDALKRLPQVGQVLGRLCTRPALLGCYEVFVALMDCVLWFYQENPQSDVEVKAKAWALTQIRSTVCHLSSQFPSQPLEELGFTQNDYNKALIQQVLQDLNGVTEKSAYKLAGNSSKPLSEVKLARACLHLCIALKYLDTSMLEAILQRICRVCHKGSHNAATAERLKLLQEVAETQANAYKGECVLTLSKSCLTLLWSSVLSSLELEVMALTSVVTEHPSQGSLWLGRLIATRPLAAACAENPKLYHAVFAMLRGLQQRTGGHASLRRLTACLHHAVVQHIRGKEADTSVSVCALFPADLRAIVNLLQFSPEELSVSCCSHQMSQLAALLEAWDTCHTQEEKRHQLQHTLSLFGGWKEAALLLMLIGPKQAVTSCCEVMMKSYGCTYLKEKDGLLEVASALRGLRSKSSLSVGDIQCAMLSVHGSADETTCKVLAEQCLLVFMVISSQGLSLTSQILTLVCGSDDAGDHLSAMLDTLENLAPFWKPWLPTAERQAKYTAITEFLAAWESSLRTEAALDSDAADADQESRKAELLDRSTSICQLLV